MKNMLIILWMIFMHICDDYYLQGWLAQGKQKKWWEQNAPDPKYKNDYLVALAMHAFSWSVMIMIPIVVYSKFLMTPFILVALIVNAIIHAIVDNAKANLLKINLIQDQSIHLLQIIVTALIWTTIQ